MNGLNILSQDGNPKTFRLLQPGFMPMMVGLDGAIGSGRETLPILYVRADLSRKLGLSSEALD
jgi:hypothetical protein